jgi:hypothetical protein
VAEEMRRRWRSEELAKGHPEKVEIAASLRRETPMNAAWIAPRLRILILLKLAKPVKAV